MSKKKMSKWVSIPTMIATGDLMIDPETQRNFNERWAKDIAKRWNPIMVGALIITPHPTLPGKYYIIDGQHRGWAARKVGEERLPVVILTHPDGSGLDEKERAEAFIGSNDDRPIPKLDAYRIGLKAQTPMNWTVENTVRSLGLEVSKSTSGTRVGSVTALFMVVKADGYDNSLESCEEISVLLRDTLQVLQQAWTPVTYETWNGDLIRGTALLLKKYPYLDQERLSAVIRGRQPRDWVGEIVSVIKHSGNPTTRGAVFSQLLRRRYNTRLRKGQLA